MKTSLSILAAPLVLTILAAFWPVFAADTPRSRPSTPSDYREAQKAVDSGDYEGAIAHLKRAMKSHSNKADVHNLLGYSYRKLGNTEKAFEYYHSALKLEPEHRGANEYIGELYLETGQLERAEERLEVLDGACFFGCEEYDELKEAIEAFKARERSSGT